MSHKPLVSVVIIFFNCEQFLPEAIASVITQTYDNWEILLVDDGSTDSSTVIAQNYAAEYPEKIHYLEHPNHQNCGQNAARNLGIKNAKGKYIALLDGDDVWLSGKLEQQIAILEQHPSAGMIYGRIYDWYGWTGNPEDQQRDRLHKYPLGVKPNQIIHPPTLLVLLLEGVTQVPNPSNLLYRREVFEQVGLFNENFRDIFEDQDFLVKVMHHLPIYVSDEVWSKYRQHSNSLMSKYDASTQQDITIWYQKRLRFLELAKIYLSQQKVQDSQVDECLNEYIFYFQKKLWLTRTPIISQIYAGWVQFLETMMNVGRRILPFTVRDWLWKNLGTRLYP